MKVSVLFPIVALLFHQTVIAKASHVPDETEKFETSLYSPQSSLSSSSSSSKPLESNIVLGSRASPLYTLFSQRQMETVPVLSETSGGCSNEQLMEKMVQPDILVTAVKFYIDSFGSDAAKTLLNPILGLSNADQSSELKDSKGSDFRARNGGDVISQEMVDQTSEQSSNEAFGESFKGAIDIGVNLPHGRVMTGHPGQGSHSIGINPLSSSRIVSYT